MGASDSVEPKTNIEGGPKGSPSLFLDLERLNGPPHYMGLDMTRWEEAEADWLALFELLYGEATKIRTVSSVDRAIDLSGREGVTGARATQVILDEMNKPMLREAEAAYMASKDKDPMVGSPHHYARFKIEPLVFIVENHGPNAIIDHVIPYLMRYDEKNGIQDIKKAIDLLEKLVRYLEGQPEWWKGNT